MGKKEKNRGNMKDDEEFDMLLGEIPHATSHHHHRLLQKRDNNHVNGSFHGMYGLMYDGTSSHYYKHTCVSPVSGFCLHSDGSSSSLFSNALVMDSAVRNRASSSTDGLIGELGLCRNRSKMYISNDQVKVDSSFRDFPRDNNPINVEQYEGGDEIRKREWVAGNGAMGSPWQEKERTCNYHHQNGDSVLNLSASLNNLSVNYALVHGKRNGPSLKEDHGSPRLIQATPRASVENLLHRGQPLAKWMATAHSNPRIPLEGLEAFTSEDPFLIQGEGLNYMIHNGLDCSREQNKGSLQEIGVSKRRERRSQRVFDEGSQLDVEIIFKEIIDHVVELMMNPFGNYLMQKFLEVCNEEQRMQILLMVTEEPGQLVKISINTHGTRVVQKLIETLKTRQQISLVISALEPGFLSLIKDLNGNHVVQRCLQCLSSEDNKFIFVAAAKYCVDIATHQHGCCVLQRCISHSTGEYKEKLVEEISSNGLLLAQDGYGNYVVQFILELKIPSATSTLVSQFQGNYVHLSLLKFSSHVVEKCLLVLNDESRTRIVRELLSTTHFKRLLQDPHANYVVQTALRVSEGPLHNSLVEATESRKAISRNSPYSKRIFSQKLVKNKRKSVFILFGAFDFLVKFVSFRKLNQTIAVFHKLYNRSKDGI
ncbi:hypothetical protein V6N12_042073 [Hibiscus sabdariffa]|uniref:PUM-HD domain-containing protein n=1 Tax=Hibiscus sabdariffa TaxID=183260 RepID=A0ABR2EFA0_9ROSI